MFIVAVVGNGGGRGRVYGIELPACLLLGGMVIMES
jgi:hypothetical protein